MLNVFRKKNKKNKIKCSNCRENNATNVRIFDYKKLPTEYFHRPDETIVQMLKYSIPEDEIYPTYWIHLPLNMICSKYPYYTCDECHKKIYKEFLFTWNRWEKLKTDS